MIYFSKMHGLGNDFVVIDNINHTLPINKIPIKKLSHRHLGIGFDQLLVIEKSEKADFFCRIFNADATEAQQCGNGIRCVARYLHEKGLISSTIFTLETEAGIIPITIFDYDNIEVQMGIPHFNSKKNYEITFNENSSAIKLSVLSLGNPHAIVQVNSLKNFSIKDIGQQIATHALFPEGVNVGFMEIVSPNHIRLKTFERGVGETFSCGSNACAALAVGVLNQLLENKIRVELPFGNLQLEWEGENSPVKMTGPAVLVFSGSFVLKA